MTEMNRIKGGGNEMKDNIEKCKFAESRVEMIAPQCTGTVIWCNKLNVEPTYKQCSECPFFQLQVFKKLVDLFHNL